MLDSLNALLAAATLFVGGHFLLSSTPLRGKLIQRLGDGFFRLLYAAVALGSFLWMILAYAGAPRDVVLWSAAPALAWVPVIVMPFALILAVCGVTTPSPTGIGGGQQVAGRPAVGIVTITRHPFLWGATLWAASHLIANGDTASFILMGSILVLSLGGMVHIDRRRELSLGSGWGPIALTTSIVPLEAVVTGRTEIDWAGIGWRRPLIALLIYGLLLGGHPHIIGVSALPF